MGYPAKPVRIGSRWITNEGEWVTVVGTTDRKATVQFNSESVPKHFTRTVFLCALRDGRVKNPYRKSVFGAGYFGESHGKVSSRSKVYQTWRGMLERCYSERLKDVRSSYHNVTCIESWHDLTEFKRWFDLHYRDGYELDKDILVKGNKQYGPDACCFVPSELNALLTKSSATRGPLKIGVHYSIEKGKYVAKVNDGSPVYLGAFDTENQAFLAYKNAKEGLIRRVSDEFYERGEISLKVRSALINYEVEEND